MSVIRVEDLKKSFKGLEVVKGLNFELKKGECIALLGPNGAGKTTTLRMMSGLLDPTEGKVVFGENEVTKDIRTYIGYLPQHPVFYEWMTGSEFLNYVGKLAGLSSNEAKHRTNELLELVGIADAKNRRVGKYSGGMKQRLGIAQAIIHRPELIMLDEPVSALDPFGRREVLELLEKLKSETTILFSTHILNDAEEVCDEILFLHNGLIVESGTMNELQEKHQQTKIDLVFREKAEQFVSSFTEQGLIDDVIIEGNKASLFVKDLDKAKVSFLKEIAMNNWPIIRFEISKMSLEDVFMKVVQK